MNAKSRARTVAHLLRSDLVAEYYIANKKTREERSLLRLQTNLLQDRTRVDRDKALSINKSGQHYSIIGSHYFS